MLFRQSRIQRQAQTSIGNDFSQREIAALVAQFFVQRNLSEVLGVELVH